MFCCKYFEGSFIWIDFAAHFFAVVAVLHMFTHKVILGFKGLICFHSFIGKLAVSGICDTLN